MIVCEEDFTFTSANVYSWDIVLFNPYGNGSQNGIGINIKIYILNIIQYVSG